MKKCSAVDARFDILCSPISTLRREKEDFAQFLNSEIITILNFMYSGLSKKFMYPAWITDKY
jgi:hypothetical protein